MVDHGYLLGVYGVQLALSLISAQLDEHWVALHIKIPAPTSPTPPAPELS